MKKYLIVGILIIAFLFRFVSVDKFPVGFNADEASFGYDAYSILHTGRDQWGNFLPIVLKSFGDYKSPVYSYLTIPSVAIFGLNIFATRLPNVVIGTLSVLAVYMLVQEISKLLEIDKVYRGKLKLEIVAGLLIAVNPWSVMMSRGAFEANLITFFLPMGIFFFLKGIKDNKYLIWSAIFFGINMFTYHSAKLITPVVLAWLIFLFRKDLLKINIKKLILPTVIFLIFFGALLYTFKIGGGARITERSIVQGALDEGFQERMTSLSTGMDSKIAKILHNKYQVIANRFVTNYFQYFSPKFLIENGAGDGSYGMIPGIGIVNGIEVLLFVGVVPFIILNKKSRMFVFGLLFWLLVTPLAAALATGIGYSGNRAEGMIPVLQIIEAFGFVGWIILLEKTKFVKPVGIIVSLLLVYEVYGFANSYFKIPPTSILKQEVSGSLETATWLSQNTNGKNVVVSRGLTEPQIFIAFVNKWNPNDFQKSTKTWGFNDSGLTWVDQLPNYSLGNYTFTSIDLKKNPVMDGYVVIKAEDYSGNEVPVKTISYSDGSPNIYILDVSKKMYAKTN